MPNSPLLELTPEQRARQMLFGEHDFPYGGLDETFVHPETAENITIAELTARYAAEDAAS